ncbi:MAG: 5-aminolevulic acid synthase [Pseudorhodobacter sp.]|nr:5-aminolevulic acid synthase [Pseudorhodobacter sp.]
MRGIGLAAVVLALFGAAACADPVTGKAAGRMLFTAEGAEVEMLAQGFLSAADTAALQMVGAAQPYYGAIAVSPEEGLMVEATVAAANYHDTEAAAAAALAGCNARRSGKTACMVVALIRPKGWQARGLQLSAAATAAIRKDYGGRAPKALAISPTSGLWGIAKGPGAAQAALADCAAKATPPLTDCTLAVVD